MSWNTILCSYNWDFKYENIYKQRMFVQELWTFRPKNKMDGKCSKLDGMRIEYKILIWRDHSMNKIKIGFGKIACENVDWIERTHNEVQCLAFVSTMARLLAP
jgi:hypothetical protein